MSIRLSRSVTAARLAANRNSAAKSTGPRTAAGKRRSSLNSIRGGGRSNADKLFWQVLMTAPVGEILETAEGLMTREQYLHYEYLLELFRSPPNVEEDHRRRKVRAEQKTMQSKPKTPLLSTRARNEAGMLLMARELSFGSRNVSDAQSFNSYF